MGRRRRRRAGQLPTISAARLASDRLYPGDGMPARVFVPGLGFQSREHHSLPPHASHKQAPRRPRVKCEPVADNTKLALARTVSELDRRLRQSTTTLDERDNALMLTQQQVAVLSREMELNLLRTSLIQSSLDRKQAEVSRLSERVRAQELQLQRGASAAAATCSEGMTDRRLSLELGQDLTAEGASHGPATGEGTGAFPYNP